MVLKVRRVVGINVIDAVFINTNMHMSSEAVSFIKFSCSSFSIAARPNGVAAFDSPRRLAVMLIDIAPAVSEFFFTFEKRSEIKGEINLCIFFVSPEFCAICKSPVQRHIIPSREITRDTALWHPSKILFVTSSVVPVKKEKR